MKSTGSFERAARIALCGLLISPQLVAPATIKVEGGCRLADAVAAANTDRSVGGCRAGSGADVIRLTGDVELATADNPGNGLPPIASPITVRGDGFAIRRADGAARFRIFDVLPEGALVLEDVTVANGSSDARGGGIRALGDLTLSGTTVSANESAAVGGGIFAQGVSLTVTRSSVSGNSGRRGAGIAGYRYTTAEISDSTISGNVARARGGGLLFHDGSPATISGSTISGNSAASGGGIRSTFYSNLKITDSEIHDNVVGLEGGGIFVHYSDLTLERSQVTGNAAERGGGIYGGGGYGYVTVRYSTLSGNTATLGGGAYVTLYYGETNVVNSTISGNSAERGGGLFQGTNFYSPAYIRSSTISQNTATTAGGVYSNANAYYDYGIHLVGTVVAGNPGGNCAGNVLDGGGANFDDDGSCPGAAPIAPGTDFDPSLANHGGGTPSHALLAGSVAIDAAECGLALDQRRFRRQGRCDSGAFEHGAEGLGGTVAGIETSSVSCQNLASRQRGSATTSATSWLCEELGVQASPGERVRIISLGTAGGSAAGGSVTGLAAGATPSVTCINRTRGGKTSFRAPGATWDCAAQGLRVDADDVIRQKVRTRF